ncbi:MAG: precorrin-6A reductase [Roseburia sp.]|nr:precorrin-6A reductase [Roseburia sp.]MCM1241799.1 precorrin-6A reductase [Roseburia sp.]
MNGITNKKIEKNAGKISGEIVIFAGTTEGRKLSEALAAAGVFHTICVATEYGEIVLNANPEVNIYPEVKVHRGRMDREEMTLFLQKEKTAVVVDATHPYAKEVTRNIKEALDTLNGISGRQNILYLRLQRDLGPRRIREENDKNEAEKETSHREAVKRVAYFATNEDCAEALAQIEGNILLTTGSKELAVYSRSESLKNRLYVRVLPGMESLSHCIEEGICGKQIIAMQGPFGVQMNEAVIRQYQISCLVTKESGISGGFWEKLEAAEKTGIKVFIIGCPQEDEGCSFAEIISRLEKILHKKIDFKDETEIILAGIGMGQENGMTQEVREAVKDADIIFGAKRMLSRLQTRGEKYPFYRAEQIIPCMKKRQEENFFLEKKRAVVLFSGDSGFYSGCQDLYEALQKEIRKERLKASVRILPGISSVSWLAACIGESYHDAAVYSMHGKEVCNLVRRIQNVPKTFLLTSGVSDVRRLGELLCQAGMKACEVTTGYQLSYEEQRVKTYTPEECRTLQEEGLYTCFIKNPHAMEKRVTPGIADAGFIRDKVPMTKEEVREVSICKLHLQEKSVVYDIGSGTGSIAIEIASLSDDIQVCAVERKKEALTLIEKNKERFGLQNITVVEAQAPEGLMALPMATHAFIGGSGGRLPEILAQLYQINPAMRIVINAISMETISEIREAVSLYADDKAEIVQLQVSRAKQAGEHHLMQAENPVWICAFTFIER